MFYHLNCQQTDEYNWWESAVFNIIFRPFQLELANYINSDGALSDKENIVRRMKNQVKHSPERMLNVGRVFLLRKHYFTIL